MRIALHTPLNAFADGRISGDRRMARQIKAGLEHLGHVVTPILDARAYLQTTDLAALAVLEASAAARTEALFADWRQHGGAPDLWFTYHSYYKAPDLFGPTIAARLGIPYIVAEASDSASRLDGEWARHVMLARKSIGAADLHLCFTQRDKLGLAPLCRPRARILDFPPFIMSAGPVTGRSSDAGSPRLITIAMMREGKYPSYLALARMLAPLTGRPWTLTIIGDGPRRGEVEQAFAALPPGRVTWAGTMAHDEALAALAAHDIFVWPGVREAYGLVYLEAQAAGLPVVAFASGGVPATVMNGETALLAPENDETALTEALTRLLDEPALRRRMGEAAARFVRTERTLETASAILEQALAAAIAAHAEAEP